MDFSAANTELWRGVNQVGVMAAVLLLANVLRRKIPFVRRSLMPTAVLAGFLVLALRLTGLVEFDKSLLDAVTYHALALGFIALSLQVPNKTKKKRDGADFVGAKSGALIVSTYLVQALVGLAVSITLAYTVMPGFFKASGILLPMGYGQGPGQANNIGSTYEALGFVGGQSFGLALAAAGFLVACVVGVIYLNVLRARGKIRASDGTAHSDALTISDFEDKGEIPISESVDRFTVQAALVLAIYLVTYFATLGLEKLVGLAGSGAVNAVKSILWGFNFIVGAVLANLCRILFDKLTKARLMTRQYPNNYLLGRISGAAFDFMVICGIAAIDFEKLAGLWLPFILMSVLGAVVTLYYLRWICKKLYPDYYYEGLLSMFGMLTGTISSGVLLLRELDPNFRTPASKNLLLGTSFGIVFGIPMLILVGLAPQSDVMAFVVAGICAVYLALLLCFMFLVKRKPVSSDAAGV